MLTTKEVMSLVIIVLTTSTVKTQYVNNTNTTITIGNNLRGLHLYWMECQRNDTHLWSMDCKIIRKSLRDENEITFCDMKLRAFNRTSSVRMPMITHVQTLSTDKAAFLWYRKGKKKTSLKIRIVKFSDCNTVESTINAGEISLKQYYLWNFLKFFRIDENEDGTFDALIDMKKLCNVRICKVKFDAQGKRQKNFTTKFYKTSSKSLLTSMDSKSSNGSYFIVDYHDNKANFSLVTSDGQRLLYTSDLMKYPLAGSTSYGTIRMCGYRKSKVNCTVYDTAGKPKSNMTVDVGHKIDKAEIKHLKTGEFFLFTRRKNDTLITATKIGVDGLNAGSISLTKIRCTTDAKKSERNDIVAINDMYCASIFCYNNNTTEYTSQCFRKEDLIKI